MIGKMNEDFSSVARQRDYATTSGLILVSFHFHCSFSNHAQNTSIHKVRASVTGSGFVSTAQAFAILHLAICYDVWYLYRVQSMFMLGPVACVPLPGLYNTCMVYTNAYCTHVLYMQFFASWEVPRSQVVAYALY